jgi:hypothetical protein
LTVDEMHGATEEWRIDRAIDRVTARRSAVGAGGEPAAAPLSSEEALILELSRLGQVDWPADEVGDRVAARVAAAAPGQPAGTWPRQAAAPGQRQPRAVGRGRRGLAGGGRLRPASARWLAAGAAAAAVALVALSLQAIGGTGGHHPGALGKITGRRTPPAANTLPRTPQGFRAVGTVNGNDNFLTCVTASICYIGGAPNGGGVDDVARTLNGGATWTSGELLPSLGSNSSMDWNAPLSCPKPMTCYSAYGPGILETTDGFAHYRYLPVTLPGVEPSSIFAELVSCPTTLHCVADVALPDNDNALIYSDNGGATWAAATAPNVNGNENGIGELQCDPDGACIAAITGGEEANPTVSALASTNGGRSWTMSGTYADPGLNETSFSCPDGRDCLISGDYGTNLAWIHVTAGGQISIRVPPVPASWGSSVTASCATASDCFVETQAAVIEVTHDGGRSWTSIPLNMPDPGEIGADLSCPVPAGCIVVGNSPSASTNAVVVLSNLRDGG